MSRAKKGTASEGQVPVQKEAAENSPSIEQLLKAMEDRLKESAKKDNKELSDRLQALELKMERSPAGNTGTQEEKSGEQEDHATEVGGVEITPPERESRQAGSSLYESSRFFRMEQPRQQPPPPPSSQPPPLPYHHPQPFSVPEPFLAGRQHQPLQTRDISSALPWKLSPPVFDGDSLKFRSFRKEATTFADCCGFGDVFEGNREIPIADGALTQAQVRLRGFTDAEIERHRKAYQFLRSALSSEVDRGILLRANSPTEAWRNLESWHNPKSISATQALHDRFQSYSMKPGQNPLVALTALEEMAAQLSQQHFSMAPNQPLIQFLSILPESEYEVEKRTFCNGLQPDREQVLMAIRSRYENLQRQRKKGGGRKDAGHAFVADAGARHGGKNSPPSARGRGKGRGRGGRRKRDGEDDQQKVASSRTDGARADSEKGGNVKCKRCGETGHKSVRCPDQICGVCGGKGHSAEVCANVVTVLACENPKNPNEESDAAISGEEKEAFICDMTGEFDDKSVDEGEGGCSALAWRMGDLTVICDSGASCHMSHSSTGMLNYRESNAYMRTASGTRYPIEGYGDLPLTFRSSSGDVPLLLRNVAHVPRLNYHLLSLRAVADNGHSYTGTQEGVTVFFSTGDTLFFPSVGRLNFLYAYRPGTLVDETANATIAPGLSPSNRDTPININDFHVAHAHAHEGALRKTAKQMGVTLGGKLHECKGCSMAKGIRMSIPSKTHSREDKRLSRVFVDLGGKKHVTSMGGNKYPMIIRDDFSRYAWLYYISHKSDAAEAFKQFLADLRVEGIPSEVVIVRSDNGGEFNQGEFGQLCRERNIKQEFTTADSPEYNGVAERGLAMIESAALAARI